MTDRDRPLEERPEVAAAVEDETTVSRLGPGGGPPTGRPEFIEPGTDRADGAETEEIIGAPAGGGTPGAPAGRRTGGEQPWDPEDLATARGQDPTPDNVERARRDLEREGSAAVEKTVP